LTEELEGIQEFPALSFVFLFLLLSGPENIRIAVRLNQEHFEHDTAGRITKDPSAGIVATDNASSGRIR